MRKILLVLALALGLNASSQIAVDNSLTMQQYVQDVLLGAGVLASNITYIGAPMQIGSMTGADANIIGMSSGLILSSAASTNIELPGAFDDVPWGTGVNGGQPDLLNVANSVPPLIGQFFNVGSVNDVCVLEFDFTATGDTVKFDYLFGSDEYLTWINTTYNDVFGFFLSGPGITGPYQSPAGFLGGAVNIANVPNSNPSLPITISSVNNGLNSQYYNHNIPHNHIAINGYTDVFQAIYPVQCGGTYHIKLAIADGSDNILESIVILEAGSFSSNASVEVELISDVGPPGANIIYEDCGHATLSFHRPVQTILEVEEMIVIEYLGIAINGVDYTFMPDTIIFPPFQTTVSFPIQAIVEGLPEGTESVEMNILNLAACNGLGIETNFQFFIMDEPPPLVVEDYEVVICEGDQVEIAPLLSGGYGNFHYEWSNIPDDVPSQIVGPLVTTDYFITVSDTCGMPSSSGVISVTIPFDGLLNATISPDELYAPCENFFDLTSTMSGGNGVYTYMWTTDTGIFLGNTANVTYQTFWNANSISLTVTDGCGFQTTTTVPILYELPGLDVALPALLTGVCVDDFLLSPTVAGGTGVYSYVWQVNGANTAVGSTFNYTAGNTADITVNVSDNCGQNGTATTVIEILPFPPVFEAGNDAQATCLDVINRELIVFDGIPDYTYLWEINGVTISTATTFSYQPTETVTVNVTVTDVCGDQSQDQLVIELIHTDIEVDFPNELFASCIDHTQLAPIVSGGDGVLSFEWQDPQGVFDTNQLSSYQTYQTTPLIFTVTDECDGTYDHPVIINIPNIPIELTVTNDTLLCIGQGLVMDAFAQGGEGGFTYYWPELELFGPQQFVLPGVASTFSVIATDICGKVGSDEVNIIVEEVNASFTYEYISSYEVQFEGEATGDCGNCVFHWTFGDGEVSSTEDPYHVYPNLESYIANLQVTNDNNCSAIVTHILNAPLNIFMPNAFTPDGDGLNDVYLIVGNGVVDFELSIFDRWGEMVFFSDNIETAWTGNHQKGDYFIPDGVYPYKLIYKGTDGVKITKRGHITLLR